MKVCSRCNIEKHDEYFYKMIVRGKELLQSYCKVCSKAKVKLHQRKIGVQPFKRKEVYVLPELKFCSRCNKEKCKDDFRVRWEKRQNPQFPYLNNTCRICDKEIASENHKKSRQTPEGRKRNCEWARKTYKKRRDKAIAQMKKKRATPEYKKMMREYRLKNKDKIYQQELITKRRYQVKNWTELSDVYVINSLVCQGVADKETLINHLEIVQAKRIQLLIIRKLKQNVN